MSGINLSQSAMQNERVQATAGRSRFGARLVWSAVLVLLAAMTWGGATCYDGWLQSGIDGMMTTIKTKESGFNGDDVDRVADFSLRVDLLKQNLAGKPDVSTLLTELQEVMFDGVVLSKYTYDQTTGVIEMVGSADSFRSLAQQLVAFRKLPKFSSLSVGDASRHEDKGGVDFSVKVKLK